MSKKVEKKVKVEESAELETPVEVKPAENIETPVVEESKFPESLPVRVSQWKVPMYFVIQVGSMAKIYGKKGTPVSGEMPLNEAARQASRHNAVDPEQLAAKSRIRS